VKPSRPDAVGARELSELIERIEGLLSRPYLPEWGSHNFFLGLQFHRRAPLDVAGDLSAAAIRTLARAGDQVRLVVTAAGREMIEEVHWGLTPREQERVLWDISWIWGPPEDQLAKLFRTIGSRRFVFGTQWPLRLVQNPRANLDLLPDDVRGMQLGSVER